MNYYTKDKKCILSYSIPFFNRKGNPAFCSTKEILLHLGLLELLQQNSTTLFYLNKSSFKKMHFLKLDKMAPSSSLTLGDPIKKPTSRK